LGPGRYAYLKNGGLGTDGKCLAKNYLTNLSEEDWNRVIVVNLKEACICPKYEVMQMIKQKYGTIVFTGPSKDGLIGLAKKAGGSYITGVALPVDGGMLSQ
jgi:NAD(P)-dependent dehydrogenase (short-subunit alcohol dehydrogenase family)